MKNLFCICCSIMILFSFLGDAIGVDVGPVQDIGLYDVFEVSVENGNTYDNPFDFNEIELQATFISPSGRRIPFFGFYDGDGSGGQSGTVWKLRFMPDETGVWTYDYVWTDGTPGNFGQFNVVDTGLRGPLKVATDNSFYFMDARNQPFHWRGYDMHSFLRSTATHKITQEIDAYTAAIQSLIIDRGYNFTMWNGSMEVSGWNESWWLDYRNNKNVFNVAVWDARETALRLAKDNGVYVSYFGGMIYQGTQYNFEDFKIFLRYWVARFGPFYNSMGWSPTWEWTDIWSADDVNRIMGYLYEINPFPTLLSTHDCSHSRFDGWLSFSMRQAQARDIFKGNSREAGKRQGGCDGTGGIGAPFKDQPIIGSEDIWETASGNWGQPRNPTEVRRAAWGIMMAGVLPLYSDWHSYAPPYGGEGLGEREVRRMFDFLYQRTDYRRYRQMNDRVSAGERQIASGISGEEYLVYDENGGTIHLNISDTTTSDAFLPLWLDPASGDMIEGEVVQGGCVVSLTSPFTNDTVLLLHRDGDGAPDAPRITSQPVTTATLGETYAYTVCAACSPAPSFDLVNCPEEMTIGTASGLIQWTPAQPGRYTVEVRAVNPNGEDRQTFALEVPSLTAPVIIDNSDAGFSVQGNWGSSTHSPDYYGRDYRTAPAGEGSLSATWQFTIPQAGVYDVSAMWAAYPSYRAWDAPYAVYNNGNLLDTVIVDQRRGGGDFNLLGSYAVQPGTLAVVLTNDASDYVTADAVKIQNLSTPDPTPVPSVSADFSAAPLSGPAPLTVNFTDASQGDIDAWSWDFNGDGTIDAETAAAAFTYTAPGTYAVSLTVSGGGESDSEVKTGYIEVTSGMVAPVIESAPGLKAWVGEAYAYRVTAVGEPAPVYELLDFPQGMTIDEETGAISWTPSQAGNVPVQVRAANAAGADIQRYSIAVGERVSAPQFTSAPPMSATVGEQYTYSPTATGAPTYELVNAPDGMVIDAASGRIEWTPARAESYTVAIKAVNAGGSDTQTFTLDAVDAPGQFDAEVITDNADPGFSVQGSWGTSTHSPHYYGNDYRTAPSGNGSFAATWRFDVAKRGQYEVSAMWAAYPSYRAWNAPYAVYNNGNLLETVRVDQRSGGGDFNLLGEYSLETGTLEVVLTNDASNYVTADAVKARFIGAPAPDPGTTAPVAEFSASPRSGSGPLTVQFTDASEGDIDTWSWDFNGDGVTDAAGPSPSHTFTDAGMYDISLTVSSGGKTDTALKTGYIEVTAPSGIPPVIQTTPVSTAFMGGVYAYDVAADGEPAPRYELVQGPAGMTIDEASGLIDWTPFQAGNHAVSVRAVNVHGEDSQTFTINVSDPGDPVIIDNSDPGFSLKGDWGSSTYSSEFQGSDYRYAPVGNGSRSVTWRFDIAVGGTYKVSATWAPHPTHRASDAPYAVYNNGVLLETVVVDQRTGGGVFNKLGAYPLEAGALEVVLTDDASHYVTADAIKVERLTF